MRQAVSARLDSYPVPLREAIDRAAREGFSLVDLDVHRPELDPQEMGASARRHLLRYLAGHGLAAQSLAMPLSSAGLADAAHGQARLERLERVLALAADMRIRSASVTLSGFDDPKTQATANEALARVAELADRSGVRLLIDDPASTAAETAARIRAIGCEDLAMLVDSAALGSQAHSVEWLRWAGGAVLRDVRRRGGVAEPVSIGQGDVDFPSLLAELAAADFRGGLSVLEDPARLTVDGLRAGREYLERFLSRSGPA
jgi:sugar phosphate isomerase/epimerase